MGMNRLAIVVIGCVVRMRVDKRRRQGGTLNSQRQRDCHCSPHGALIVRDPAHGVKAVGADAPGPDESLKL